MSSPRVCLLVAACVVPGLSAAEAEPPPTVMAVENEYARLAVGADGRGVHLVDKQTGTDHAQATPRVAFAQVTKGGKAHDATQAAWADGVLTLTFAEAAATVRLKVTASKHYFEVDVLEVGGEGIESLVFVDLPLGLRGTPQEPFAACALALNLQTRVGEIPQATSRLWAACYPRFGFVGAKAAIVACPTPELRRVLQEVVTAAPDLPHSPIGGPWALDGPNNRGSYLFDFGALTEETVDAWIEVAQSLGISQIDFHGGTSFRFGDCQPNPTLYPRGVASMKAVIDRLHAAGILAGLHTYAMFMAKTCPWVTPVPDPRLGKDATFTLAADLPAAATAVPVVESTAAMSTTTGFFVRNSVTLQVDDELITYGGFAKEAPFSFSQCQRGAYGTAVAAHSAGAKVHHLRECFGLFVPDGDSTLYTEAAAKTAELYNQAGFDMIYLDALDGGDTVAGGENAWHYESKFTFEIWKRLQRPAIMEMSTFHHHLWYVRSRMGAWDHPNRSHKQFIDIHCQANEVLRRQFLPGHLGWWAFKTWQGPLGEPTFADDIEYLCGKALGTGAGLSIMGIDPTTRTKTPSLLRLAAIVRRYECLRRANYFGEAVRERLQAPGAEFTLVQAADGEWQFRPVAYARHRVQGSGDWSRTWRVDNRYEAQPLRLRLELLMSAGAYDAEGATVVADLGAADALPEHSAQPGITAALASSTDQVKVGANSGLLSASNTTATATRSWCQLGKTFTPPLDLSARPALGLWVYGDGKGEVLNLQQTSPSHLSSGIADHYVVIDFTGWRYVELVEPEGARHAAYAWPYGGIYSIYRESAIPSSIATFSVWLNNLPPGESVQCYLSPVRALPTVAGRLRNPTVTVNGQAISFPVEMESGQVLEFDATGGAVLYGPAGEELARVAVPAGVPGVKAGANEVSLSWAEAAGPAPRAAVSVITQGDPLRGANPPDQVRWDLLRREDDDPRLVDALDGVRNRWEVRCRPGPGTARLEAEFVVESVTEAGEMYADPSATCLEAFDNLDAFADTPANRYLQYVVSGPLKGVATAPGVIHDLTLVRDAGRPGPAARYTATSPTPGGWSARGRRFDPPLDLSACTHAGFVLNGDGQGETVYLQLRDTKGAWFDMKVGVGFRGWKYREFALAGAACDLSKVEYLIVYYNGLPTGKTCTCDIGAVRAWRDSSCVRDPVLEIGGRQLRFPVVLQAGQRLVYRGLDDCRLVGTDGHPVGPVKPVGAPPALAPGANPVTLSLDAGTAKAFRVRVLTRKVYE